MIDPSDITRKVLYSNPKVFCCIDVFRSARDNGIRVRVVKTHEEGRNTLGLTFVE